MCMCVCCVWCMCVGVRGCVCIDVYKISILGSYETETDLVQNMGVWDLILQFPCHSNMRFCRIGMNITQSLTRYACAACVCVCMCTNQGHYRQQKSASSQYQHRGPSKLQSEGQQLHYLLRKTLLRVNRHFLTLTLILTLI